MPLMCLIGPRWRGLWAGLGGCSRRWWGIRSVVVGDVVLADEGQAELVAGWGVGARVGVSGSVVGLLAGAVARYRGGGRWCRGRRC